MLRCAPAQHPYVSTSLLSSRGDDPQLHHPIFVAAERGEGHHAGAVLLIAADARAAFHDPVAGERDLRHARWEPHLYGGVGNRPLPAVRHPDSESPLIAEALHAEGEALAARATPGLRRH